MPVPYDIMLHIPPTNYHLPAAKRKSYEKAYLFTKILKTVLEREKSQKNGTVGRKKRRQKEQWE